jgi:hypothetical protein
MCRDGPAEPYCRDAGPPVPLPAEAEQRCGFVLYPYVSATFAEAVLWSVHAEAVEQLRAGASHPARDQVLELVRLAEAREAAWAGLARADQDCVWSRGIEGAKPPGGPSAELQQYLDLEDAAEAVAESLRVGEIEKIRRALAELDGWLVRGG